jgi:hypothetical protein
MKNKVIVYLENTRMDTKRFFVENISKHLLYLIVHNIQKLIIPYFAVALSCKT